MHVKSVQQQINTVDCGVFAIAFITHLLYGKDPSTTKFNSSQMRHHLAGCLQNDAITVFPEYNEDEKSVDLSYCHQHTVTVILYCMHRLPWFEDDITVRTLRMAQCDRRDKWFHQGCAKISDEMFRKKNLWWICPQCLH